MQKGEVNLIPHPQQVPLVGNYLLFSTVVLVMLFSQLFTTPFSKIIEYSGLIEKNESLRIGTFNITKNMIPETFVFSEISVFLTSTKKASTNSELIITNTEYIGNKNISQSRKRVSAICNVNGQISTEIFKQRYLRVTAPDVINIAINLIPSNAKGYFVQIKGNSFTRLASILGNTLSILAISIICGIKTLIQYKFARSFTTDRVIIALYVSSLLFVFPSYVIQNYYVYMALSVASCAFPGFFVISSFKVLEKAAPLVPFPVFIKEWTKYILGILVSVPWLFAQIMDNKGFFIFLFILFYLFYVFIIITAYKTIQEQQRRIEESSAVWMRYMFYAISLFLTVRLIIPCVEFDTEVPFVACELGDWIIVGCTGIAMSYFIDDNGIEYFNDDPSCEQGTLITGGGSETTRSDFRKDDISKRRNIVDDIFDDAFDDNSDDALRIPISKVGNGKTTTDIFSTFQ